MKGFIVAAVASVVVAAPAQAAHHPRDRHGCYANTTSAHWTTPTFRLAQTWGTRKSNLIVSSNIACSTAGALVRHWTRGGMSTVPLTPARHGYARGEYDAPLTRKWGSCLRGFSAVTCGRHWRRVEGGWVDQFVVFAYPKAIATVAVAASAAPPVQKPPCLHSFQGRPVHGARTCIYRLVAGRRFYFPRRSYPFFISYFTVSHGDVVPADVDASGDDRRPWRIWSSTGKLLGFKYGNSPHQWKMYVLPKRVLYVKLVDASSRYPHGIGGPR